MPTTTRHFTPKGHGEIDIDQVAEQLPTRHCKAVKLKAKNGNTNTIFIGTSSAVTISDGATDETTGYALRADQEMEIVVGNLDQLYAIAGADNQVLIYFLYT